MTTNHRTVLRVIDIGAYDATGRPLIHREPGTLTDADKADARLLLDALGLLTPDGIAADDTRTYEVGTSYDTALYGKGDRK